MIEAACGGPTQSPFYKKRGKSIRRKRPIRASDRRDKGKRGYIRGKRESLILLSQILLLPPPPVPYSSDDVKRPPPIAGRQKKSQTIISLLLLLTRSPLLRPSEEEEEEEEEAPRAPGCQNWTDRRPVASQLLARPRIGANQFCKNSYFLNVLDL